MTMIMNLPPQLAGGARLQTLDPSWNPPGPPAAPDAAFEPSEAPCPNGALRRAREAAESHPHNPLAHARLAQAAQAGGENQEAIDAARHTLTLALDAGHAPAAHAAISVLEATSHGAELAAVIDDPRAARFPLSLRARAALAAGEHATALSILTDPTNTAAASPQTLSLLTWLYLEQGEYRQAVAAGRRAQVGGGAGVALYANLGYAHAALGNLPKAIRLTRQAVALAPTHRAVGLNLVLYHKLKGEQDAALACLERLRDGRELDIQLALATAAVMVYAGEHENARRVLQRVRASAEWARASAPRRADLEANLAFLRWKTGSATAHTTITSLRRALSASEYKSLSIAYLLCNLLVTSKDAPLLTSILERLQSRHEPTELAGMWMALALLEQNPEETLRRAVQWSQTDILNPNAAALATLLIADLKGDYRQAGELGLRALARAPSHRTLLNNTAYALALAGEHQRARRLIDGLQNPGDCWVEITATRALVALMSGQIARGLDGYRHAWDLARAQRDEQLADRVAINAVLACRSAGLDAPAIIDKALLERLAATVPSRPASWILSERVQRELRPQLPEHDGEQTPDVQIGQSGHPQPLPFPLAYHRTNPVRQIGPGRSPKRRLR